MNLILKMHFYVIKLDNVIKYGIFNTNYSRLLDGQTYCSKQIECLKLFIIDKNDNYKLEFRDYDKIYSQKIRYNKINELEELYDTELPIMRKLYRGLIKEKYGGSELLELEYINIFIESIYNELPKLGLNIIREYTDEEINEIMNTIRKNNYDIESNYNIRDYQQNIINYIYRKLLNESKIYLELATGAGKTFISFQILKQIQPKIIVIFSPRTLINIQNTGDSYLNFFDIKYDIINFPKDNIIPRNKNIIMTCCYQSKERLYQIIKDYDNIFIWFDESHWGIEDTWLDSESEDIEFWLNSSNIKYRLFTSASPNRNIVLNNKNIFGELYRPIEIKQLIRDKWLCPIYPYIFNTPENDQVNLCNYIINNFIKLGKNYGISFHSRTDNAFILFNKHLELYINNKINIRPFLIIGNGNTNVNEKINKIKENNSMNYDFTDLNIFMNTKNSIVYSVKKLDMGWDFSKLDYICFSDPKLSFKDIIQSIGRGTRPDKLGSDGKNRDKKLCILLPVFIRDNELNDYTQIVNVLKYLIYDVGLDIIGTIINKNNREQNNNNIQVKYEGDDEKTAVLLDLLGFKITLKELYNIMIQNKIYNDEDYYTFRNNNDHLKLKQSVYDYEGFKWKLVVDINGSKYYKTYEECVSAYNILINEIHEKYKNNTDKIDEILIDIEENGNNEINKYDKMFPPYNKIKEYYY